MEINLNKPTIPVAIMAQTLRACEEADKLWDRLASEPKTLLQTVELVREELLRQYPSLSEDCEINNKGNLHD